MMPGKFEFEKSESYEQPLLKEDLKGLIKKLWERISPGVQMELWDELTNEEVVALVELLPPPPPEEQKKISDAMQKAFYRALFKLSPEKQN